MDERADIPASAGRASRLRLVVGVAALVAFLAAVFAVFSLLGIEPAREVGPLPWMAK